MGISAVGSITVRPQYSNNSFEKIFGSKIFFLCCSLKLSKYPFSTILLWASPLTLTQPALFAEYFIYLSIEKTSFSVICGGLT